MTAAITRPNVRLIRRIGCRGLSSTVIEGVLGSMAPFIAVMDADMQHDETALMRMLLELRSGETDLVVGTRYTSDGGVGDCSQRRQVISWIGTKMAHVATGTKLSDPMSGYFMISRATPSRVSRGIFPVRDSRSC